MGGDKHGSKSGRYVGGFLQLFDWNAKSRKKLFPSKSDLPEPSKQGKKDDGNLPMTRMRVVEEEEFGAGLSIRAGSEYSYASSVTDDDGYGTKAPGVVARLMGLDCLPTSNAVEPYPSPFFDSLSLQDVPLRGRNLDFYRDHQIMHSSHLFDKVEATRRNALDSRPPKMFNRPIEKFQTDVLPPKSAKTIPIPHHKLLSPIKSPIFMPSQDAAHIMEAAARIIEPGPQATRRAKISSVGSSSVPFKVRELRERLVAAQRPKASAPSQKPAESNAAKYLREQPMDKSWNGSVETASFKASPSRDDSSTAVKNKGKSISLAIQAKVNVQKREGLTSSSKSLGGSEEHNDTKSTQSYRNQQSNSKVLNRKSLTQSTSSVLRQNNQKQNCPPYRDKPASKSSAATSIGKKAGSEDTSHVRQRSSSRDAGTSRTSSRKSSLQARDGDKGAPYPSTRSAPRKKRSIDGSLHFNKNQVSDDIVAAGKHEKPSQSSMVGDRQYSWIEENRRKGMDVVSFTFTAPITRSLPGSEPTRQWAGKSSNLFTDESHKMLLNSDNTRFSSPNLNALGGDALSILLEQKLKELASNLGSPQNFVKRGTSAQQTAMSPASEESAIGKAREKIAQQEQRGKDVNSQIYSGLFTNEPEPIRRRFNFQAGEAMEEYGSSNAEAIQWNDPHLPSPVSILEPSMLTESCYSSESVASSTEESKLCSSVRAQEVVGSSSLQTFHPMETDAEVLDSASSMQSQVIAAKDSTKSTTWELGYVKDILCNVELMFKDYVTGRTREIVNPHLFDQMERRQGGLQTGVVQFKLERKILFDCVSECLDMKCQRFVGGGFGTWTKGIATLKRNERLAEEVHKEIQGWRNLGDSMVDELVDKDMSSKYGRWLDFEVDEFMLGVDIEGQIIDSLVVELVADILPSTLYFL